MNIHEYPRPNSLLARYGVTVPLEIPTSNPRPKCAPPPTRSSPAAVRAWSSKSRSHAGGRGKAGTFEVRFSGRRQRSPLPWMKPIGFAGKMLGSNARHQTDRGTKTARCRLLLLAASIKIKEFYLAVLFSTCANSRPLIMASTEGGMDIQEVAEKHPEFSRSTLIPPSASCPSRLATNFRRPRPQRRLVQRRRQTHHRRLQCLVGNARCRHGRVESPRRR